MRRALIVGIDDYSRSPLEGCVNDATEIDAILSRNADGSPNFSCKKIIVPPDVITRPLLIEALKELFSNEADVALFYFSGHGTANNLGGFLVTQDAERYDEGVRMTDLLTFANCSKAHEIVILLDCCHSGAFGALPAIDNVQSHLREGISVLTSSRVSQVSVERGGRGVFTALVSDALKGGASDVLGNVTVASLYAYIDQALGAWDQRPLFKSHVSKLISLRRCEPEIEYSILRLLPKYFPSPINEFRLDPSYEPDSEPKHPDNEKIFGHLQKYRAARLLTPVGEEHMYYAAMNSKSCKLTPLGQFYRLLANDKKI